MKPLAYLLLATTLSIAISSCHRASRQEQCAEMIKKERRRLPRHVGEGVTLDSMTYNPATQTISYYHTLTDTLFTDEMIEYGRQNLQEQMRQEISNSVALKRLKDDGISFRYIYLGSEKGNVRLQMTFNNKELL